MNKSIYDIYDTEPDFKLYVDKYCKCYRISKDEALTHVLVKEYANYILSKGGSEL